MKTILLASYLRTLKASRIKSRVYLEKWQDDQVENFLTAILPKSPFYRAHFAKNQIKDWKEFPTIDKALMMENFDTLNTVGANKQGAFEIALKSEETRDFRPTIQKNITVGLSSGTSGNRGLFLVSERERMTWAGSMLAKVLPSTLLHRHKVAFFLRANSNLYSSVTSSRIEFHYFDLLESMQNHVERLNELMPSLLVAPPSMLRLLTDQIRRGFLWIKPQKIVSVAEVLDPLDEQLISHYFDQKVHQVYQCTEGFLGATCKHGTLHLNEDSVVIQKEYLDDEKRRFSPIITDFRRTTQPIIRYRLNDILCERREPCPCGSVMTAIEFIEGRCDDIFMLPLQSTQKLVPVFPDFIRRAIISVAQEVREYRVTQKGPRAIEVALDITQGSLTAIEHRIDAAFTQLFQQLGVLPAEICYTQYQRHPAMQKMKRVCRESFL